MILPGYLFDTCVLTLLTDRKRAISYKLVVWLQSRKDRIYVSSMTVHEQKYGARRVALRKSVENQIRGARIEKENDAILIWLFDGHILPVETHLLARAGEIRAEAEKICGDIGTVDSTIAATAEYYNLTVVTQNTKHFLATGVRVVDIESLYGTDDDPTPIM
jgi:predicted nucleic acid-binding protein